MRAVDCSLVSQNVTVTEEVLKKENELQKRKTYEKEENEDDARTRGRVGRSSGRGREVRAAGGRERRWRKRRKRRRRSGEKEQATLGRSIDVRGGSC